MKEFPKDDTFRLLVLSDQPSKTEDVHFIITRDVEKLQFLAFSEQMLNMHLLQWLIRTPMKCINFLVIG